MQTFIKFPSIVQFRDAVKQVQQSAKYHNVTAPVVTIRGTVKLHGTNAAIVINKEGQWWCQSRERIITPENDNAGFAAWAYGNKKQWDEVAKNMACACGVEKDEYVQIYGEWCGGNIQESVGLQYLPKQFVVFDVRFSKQENPQESTDWSGPKGWPFEFIPGVSTALDYQMYEVELDFNNPGLVQNRLAEITEAVEKDCPVARQLLGAEDARELVGEGVVWTVGISSVPNYENNLLFNTLRNIRFKVKGKKHSVSKVKTLAAVDEEKLKSVSEFVEYACTENRLNQGLDKFKELGLEFTTKNTGEFIRWVMQDILKEELGAMAASTIEPKDVNSSIAKKAREFYFKVLED